MKPAVLHVGYYIKLFIINGRHVTQEHLAKHIRVSRLTINELIGGKRNLTPRIALRLAAASGINANQWLDYQRRYDLCKVGMKEYRALERIRLIWPCNPPK